MADNIMADERMMDDSKTSVMSVSFAFTKKSSSKKLLSIVHNDDPQDKELVYTLDDKEIKGSKPKKVEEKLVIPLITQNKWRSDSNKGKKEHSGDNEKKKETVTEDNDIQSLAIQEVIADASKLNDNWEDRDKLHKDVVVPLLMKNKIPDGFEDDDKLDVSLRPDEPEDADYSAIPISAFGEAMLRGMGWKDGQGIGKGKEKIAPLEPVLRPKGLGLGAKINKPGERDTDKKVKYEEEEEEALTLKRGAYCLVKNGKYADYYGKIEGIDEDNARVMVKLTVTAETVNISQYNIVLVREKEYKKNSKYINKSKADKYREDSIKKLEKESRDHDEKRRKKDKHRDKDKDDRESDYEQKERKHKKSKHRDDRGRSDSNERYDDRNGRQSDSYRKDKKKDHDDRLDHPAADGSNGRLTSLWVRPKIRVRIIDKDYKKGKYYKSKVEVIDVMGMNNCICKTEDGKLLEDLHQSYLETVIPRNELDYVFIVAGKLKGQLAQLIDRDKYRSIATIQLVSDRKTMIKADYESICEYVGDVDDEMEF